jgi:hypothetical protein
MIWWVDPHHERGDRLPEDFQLDVISTEVQEKGVTKD